VWWQHTCGQTGQVVEWQAQVLTASKPGKSMAARATHGREGRGSAVREAFEPCGAGAPMPQKCFWIRAHENLMRIRESASAAAVSRSQTLLQGLQAAMHATSKVMSVLVRAGHAPMGSIDATMK
jgi:hypothetical protein